MVLSKDFIVSPGKEWIRYICGFTPASLKYFAAVKAWVGEEGLPIWSLWVKSKVSHPILIEVLGRYFPIILAASLSTNEGFTFSIDIVHRLFLESLILANFDKSSSILSKLTFGEVGENR